MAIIRPSSDNQKGLWTPSTGTTLYETVDESSVSDTDYISTESSGGKSGPFLLINKCNKQPNYPVIMSPNYRDAITAYLPIFPNLNIATGVKFKSIHGTLAYAGSQYGYGLYSNTYNSDNIIYGESKNLDMPGVTVLIDCTYRDQIGWPFITVCATVDSDYDIYGGWAIGIQEKNIQFLAGYNAEQLNPNGVSNSGGNYLTTFGERIVAVGTFNLSTLRLRGYADHTGYFNNSCTVSSGWSNPCRETINGYLRYGTAPRTNQSPVRNIVVLPRCASEGEVIELIKHPYMMYERKIARSYSLACNPTRTQLQLSSTTDPGVDTGHKLIYRGSGNFKARLKSGTTNVAEWQESLGTLTTVERTLTEQQAATITNYADLRVEFDS